MAEGVVLVRQVGYERAGGWPGHFFLFHEGIDLTWRLSDFGCTGWYAPGVAVHHPATDLARHAPFNRLGVWFAGLWEGMKGGAWSAPADVLVYSCCG